VLAGERAPHVRRNAPWTVEPALGFAITWSGFVGRITQERHLFALALPMHPCCARSQEKCTAMGCVRQVIPLLVLVLALVAPATAPAQVVKHFGVLLDVDADAWTIVLAEMGPWRLDTETAVITVHTVAVTGDTEFLLVRRGAAPSGVVGDLITEEIEPWAIYPGDFLTVDCVRRGEWMVALRIVVVEDGAP
jgi:hypothetical protein